MNEERELGWNDTIQNDSPEYKPLPAGEYPFTVTAFERGRHTPKPGGKLPPCNMAKVTLRVDGGTNGTADVFHRLYLHSRCEGLLCEFFTGIGHRQHGQPLVMDWQRVVGSTGRVKLSVRTYDGKQNNEVKAILDPAKSAAAAQPQQQWGATAPAAPQQPAQPQMPNMPQQQPQRAVDAW